ncbi:hypothetical protein BJY00DRAFT_152861 [Aspergillus carlsbadensis]|nr:hypothetical protein BJY00DRAFT_152861 [Aspergillus carlsbadensis]
MSNGDLFLLRKFRSGKMIPNKSNGDRAPYIVSRDLPTITLPTRAALTQTVTTEQSRADPPSESLSLTKRSGNDKPPDGVWGERRSERRRPINTAGLAKDC